MLWKTCLDHSLEILGLLVGSGILGYLFSKWFGSQAPDKSLIDSYENQIKSLHDRIKTQDIELRSSLAGHSEWASEKSGLLMKIDELNDSLSTMKNSYAGYKSQSEFQSLQERFDQDLKLASTKIEKALLEKNELQQTIKSLESKAGQSTGADARIKELESQLLNFKNISEKDKATWIELEKSLKDKHQADLQSKNNEITQLQGVRVELENQKSIAAAFSSKENEYQQQLDAQKSENGKFQSENAQLKQQIVQLNESNQAGMSRLNETTGKLHQLENELTQAQKSTELLKNQASELEKLKAGLAASNSKTLEWEGRWKQASLEAEQFKVAHANLSKEREQLQQKVGYLESELVQAKSQIESSQANQLSFASNLEEAENKYKSVLATVTGLEEKNLAFNSMHEQFQAKHAELEASLRQAQTASLHLENQLDEARKQTSAQAAALQEWHHKYEAIHQQFEEKEQGIQQLHQQLNEWHHKYEAIHQQFEEKEQGIQQLHRQLNEWHQKYEAIHQQFEEKEQTILQLHQQLNEWHQTNEQKTHQLAESESRYKELIGRFNTVQTHLADAQKASTSNAQQLVESEHIIKDLQARISKTELELSIAHKANDTGHKHLQEVEAQNKELQARLYDINHQLDQTKYAANEQAENQLKEQALRYNELNSDFLALQSELQLLQSIEAQNKELSAKLSTLEDQVIRTKKEAEEKISQQVGDHEGRYKELYSKFTTVQLQLADAQRSKVHMDQDLKNTVDQKNKLQGEVSKLQKQLDEVTAQISSKEASLKTSFASETAGFQKRIQDLSLESTNKEAILKSKFTKELGDLSKTNAELRSQIEKLTDQLQALETASKITAPLTRSIAKPVVTEKAQASKTIKSPGEKPAIKAKPITPPVSIKPDWKNISLSLGKKVTADDHKIIEGIGPKINQLLKKAKINTWTQLANTPVNKIQEILDKGGNKFSLADPKTWAQQADLAAKGEWIKLRVLQDGLNARTRKKKSKGNEKTPVKTKSKTITPAVLKQTKSKVIKPVIDLVKGRELLGIKFKEDDLIIIEGIGPKIKGLLNKAGIKTWKKLAETDTKAIQALLDKGGSKFSLADPKTWPKQSSLAAAGDWSKLKNYQNSLKGGKKQ